MIWFREDWQTWMATLANAGEDRMPWMMFTDWMEENVEAETDRVLWEFIRGALEFEESTGTPSSGPGNKVPTTSAFARKFSAVSARKQFIEYTRELYPTKAGGEAGNMRSLIARHDGTPDEIASTSFPCRNSPFGVELRWYRGLPRAARIHVNRFRRNAIIGRLDYMRSWNSVEELPVPDEIRTTGAYVRDWCITGETLNMTAGFVEHLLQGPALLATILQIHLRTPVNEIVLTLDEIGLNISLLKLGGLGLRELFVDSGLHRVWRARHEETRSVAGKLMYPSLRYEHIGGSFTTATDRFQAEIFQWLHQFGLDWPRLHATNLPLIAAILPEAQRIPFNGIISLPLTTLARLPETQPQSSPTL